MTHVKALQAGHSSQGTSEPITPVYTDARENIHQTISIIRRLVRNRREPLGYANCAWGTESSLWTSRHWQFRACIPITPWVVGLERVCLRAAEQRSYTSSPTLARQLQLSVPCNQVNRGVDADKIYFQPQCLHVLPSCVMETPRSILGAIQKGQVVNILRSEGPLLSYSNPPSQ